VACTQWPVLGSVLVLLAVTAAVLLVPSLVGLLGVERHRHLAETEDSTRRLRLVLAATLVGLASLLVVALAGGGVLAASVVAVVLAGSVLVWAPLSHTWAVRGVVVWALVVSGEAGLMAWFAYTFATSGPSALEWVLGGAVWLLLLLVLARLLRLVRRLIAGRSGLVAHAATRHTPLLRPALSLAALLATSGVVVAVASGNGGTAEEARTPQAGLPDTSTSAGVRSLPPPSVGTRTAGPGQPTAAQAGVVGTPWSPASSVVDVALPRRAPYDLAPATKCPTEGTWPSAPAGVGGHIVSDADSRPGGVVSPGEGSTPKAPKPTSLPSSGPSSPAPGAGSGTAAPGSGTGDGPGPGPFVRPTPLLPVRPVASPTAALTRLLGFEKDKPNRPSQAPSPGHGRPGNARTPVLPAPVRPSSLPPVALVPPPRSVTPDQPGAKPGKRLGHEKDKPKRPAPAQSPGHGRPSPS
jgi:hypothetical protein